MLYLAHKSQQDHPRVCGEHALFASAKADPLGSSPRMRGTRENRFRDFDFDGIIPAYAGNTYLRPSMVSMTRDHPRVCGEHNTLNSVASFAPGSSPRMRGTH